MGAARRHAQRPAVCPDRHGAIAAAIQLAARAGSQFAGRGDFALAPADRGAGHPAAATLAHSPARDDQDSDLGRAAWWGFGSLGAGAAAGAGARSVAEHHLHCGAVVNSAAGPEHRQTGQARHP